MAPGILRMPQNSKLQGESRNLGESSPEQDSAKRTPCLWAPLLAASMALAGCDRRSDIAELNLIGGRVVQAGEIYEKHVVALVDSRDRDAFCSGTLITRRHVLTAAHCVTPVARKFSIAFGRSARNSLAMQTVGVAIHEKYDPQSLQQKMRKETLYDIAIVTLAGDAPASHEPAEIASMENLPLPHPIYIVGFGATSPRLSEGVGLMRVVETTMSDSIEARSEIRISGNRGSGSCRGDSGGPAFIVEGSESRIIGVTSWGHSICNGESWSTDVRRYHEWIIENTSLKSKPI